MYAIKINKTNRYVSYFDKNWYETSESPLYLYDYEQAKSAFNILKTHYIYKVELVSEDGNIETLNAFNKVNPIVKDTVKKNIRTINTSRIKDFIR